MVKNITLLCNICVSSFRFVSNLQLVVHLGEVGLDDLNWFGLFYYNNQDIGIANAIYYLY